MSISLWFKKTHRPKSNLEITVNILKGLKKERFEQVYTSNLSIIKLTTYYTSVKQYTSKIGEFQKYLGSDDVVYKILLPDQIYTVNMYKFFLDSDGCYINVIEEGGIFIDTCIDFLTLYNELNNKPLKSLSDEKNLLFFNELVTNLLTILKNIVSNI